MRHLEIDTAAARWISKQTAETWTKADQAAFEAWLAAATEHRIAFLRLRTAWRRAERLAVLQTTAAPGLVPPRGAWNSWLHTASADPTAPVVDSGTTRRRLLAAALAMGVALIALTAGFFITRSPTQLQLTTAVGMLDEVQLQDGSHVVVNSSSQLQVEMRGTERRVQITSGEGLFDVAKDRRRPFVVIAGHDRIEAVGTRFSVWRRTDGTRVVVRDGVVKLQSTGGGPATGTVVALAAGSIADITAVGFVIKHMTLSDIDEMLDWRSGYVAFIDATLGEAAEDFNRYNVRQIVIADPEVASLKVGGRFRASSPDRFASVIGQTFPVRVEYGPTQITMRSLD